ncbi:hypothetical protein BLNAU_21063 [Blattamonas nauphoetae]|uniref:Uncharacterized protein n=1 Tax=Blattamonas nauphoetae TaxID=2049346 RepID=A0ABQ9WWW2_9EUKA|nr:hypothetical protein BLNAU_21063 [Blattamonas nauphoetae]
MADRPKVPVSVTSEFPLFTLQFYENEEEEAKKKNQNGKRKMRAMKKRKLKNTPNLMLLFLKSRSNNPTLAEKSSIHSRHHCLQFRQNRLHKQKKTEAEIREAIERLTRQGEEIRDKREQAAREKEKNETPKTKQITEKEKTKIVNKLYEDAKRRNEEQRKKEEEKRRQQEEEEAKLEKEVKKKYGKATQRNYVHCKELTLQIG